MQDAWLWRVSALLYLERERLRVFRSTSLVLLIAAVAGVN